MSKLTDTGYRTPNDLEVGPTPIKNVLVIGSCLVSAFPDSIPGQWPGATADWIALNNVGELPERPPRDVAEYDFQLVQLATRSFLREKEYIALKFDRPQDWAALFEEVASRLELILQQTLRYNREHGLLTFVSNLLVPQQNPHGRLLPRDDYRNFTYFFRQLNARLDAVVARHANAYVLDVDEIASSIGKRYIQDDAMWTIAHNSAYSSADMPLDQGRIQVPPVMESKFRIKTWEFVLECLNELRTSYRTIRGIDAVKLVVTDLDDTLWRGISGEWDSARYTDGWPTGYAEALAFLAQRGILLAVISKNDEATARRNWSSIIPPEAFSVLKINWVDKVTNMTEILAAVNLLPQNVLYMDDNPVERENMRKAFPAMRIGGEDPHLMRRMLLWSAELQLPQITQESAARTEMVQGQVRREEAKRVLSREDFLAGLNLRMKVIAVPTAVSPAFPRCFELLNKTNQFNTTGVRWTHEQILAAMAQGMSIFAFECEDQYTQYGIVSVVLADRSSVRQMVMSCRIFGLHVEEAIVHELVDRMGWAGHTLRMAFQDTTKNRVSLDNLSAIGFVQDSDALVCTWDRLKARPPHIAVSTSP